MLVCLNFEEVIIKENLESRKSSLMALVTVPGKKELQFVHLLLIIFKIKLVPVFTTYPAIVLSNF